MDGLEPVVRMTRDIRAAAATLSDEEARFLVDAYYAMQKDRIGQGNAMIAAAKQDEPHAVLAWLKDQSTTLEGQIKGALDKYSAAHAVGRWSRSIKGIGPVIAAGLLAHIDITRAPTAGHIWRFAGLDPTVRWEKGKLRPWNASLKVLAWKIGQSFVKVSGGDDPSPYGVVYRQRKALEVERNEAGKFADQAAATLAERKIKDTATRAIYAAGRLPPGRLELRAERYAVKLFLAHWQHVAWEVEHGEPPPKPYAMSILGHGHYIGPPNWPMTD